MADFRTSTLDYFPENILIDILSYLGVRELIRTGRVCKRWRRLVKDQRLWRTIDLTAWKGVTSRMLWVLLRQYLGTGLRCLRLRGLLLSARGGAFLSESWLKALSSRCPRLRSLSLLHADLRGLRSCQLLPTTLQVLELRGCELPQSFFTQTPPSPEKQAEAASTASTQQQGRGQTGKVPASTSGIAIETMVLDNVPSFTDLHLQSLASWLKLSRLELRNVLRVTAEGLRRSAAQETDSGLNGLSRLKYLEIGHFGRPGAQLQMASLGLGVGWLGLEELSLGGKEVGPGLLSASRLRDLKRLRLRCCKLREMQVLRSCRTLRELRRLEFCEVFFQVCPKTPERGGERERQGEEGREDGADGGDESNDKLDENDPVPSLRRSLAALLPQCTLLFTNCTVTTTSD
ncbi:F-box/LRR-repeat protein 12 [Salmo salar]|uniref:F-box/LRR-repeat protein 12 n=1 Tax=Salmo salar TaxID=8030 RepID=A0A1S3R5G6_SALSA|nr:F-box/LRR-repeat protein 12-like [Salmo salar]|eukprot:XP_014047608.1 PREDICTED: F-box/LRR-repeat protein 12-like [Salmo salar]